ncbi:hypothetical protein Tco_0085441 [Tanacetum coccineum]
MVTYSKKTEGREGFHQIVDFLNSSHIRFALTENPTIYVSLIQQFWNTATTRTLDKGEMEITATIDRKVKIVFEASIRRYLKLKDSDSISNLPATKIFEKLTLMGSPTQTNVAYEAASTCVDVRHGGAATTGTSLDAEQGSGNIDKTTSMPHDSPLLRVHTLGSNVGRMQHNELMDLVTKFTASASSAKYKGKAIMDEAKTIQTKTKLQPITMKDLYEKLEFQAEIEEEESKKKKKRITRSLSMRERDTLLHKELKKGETSPSDNTTEDLHSQYIKEHWESHTQKQLKSYTLRNQEFVKTKIKDKEEMNCPQERIQQMMIIVPEQGMNVEALQTKYPIIDWEIYTEELIILKIIKVGNTLRVFLATYVLGCKTLGGTKMRCQRMKCLENFLGRSSCKLKGPEDEVFGRILSENKILIQET